MPAAQQSGLEAARTVRVWDPFLRVFHWTLLVAFVVAFATHEDGFSLTHLVAGYVTAALVAFRIIWGVVGPGHARFADFVRGPGPTLRYLRGLATGTAQRSIGHNPAGGAMAVVMLLLLIVCCLSGWLMTTRAYYADAALERIHDLSVDILLICILFHLVGVIFSSVAHRENLVKAMITGRKRAAHNPDADSGN